jgi:hypothetical protein
MSLVTFASHSIIRTRPARVKDHGSWVDDWSTPDALTVDGCVVFPGVSDEQHGRADADEVLYTVLAPEGTDIRSIDRVEVDLEPGLPLSVHGRPRRVPSPTGRLAHVQIELSEWKVQ